MVINNLLFFKVFYRYKLMNDILRAIDQSMMIMMSTVSSQIC